MGSFSPRRRGHTTQGWRHGIVELGLIEIPDHAFSEQVVLTPDDFVLPAKVYVTSEGATPLDDLFTPDSSWPEPRLIVHIAVSTTLRSGPCLWIQSETRILEFAWHPGRDPRREGSDRGSEKRGSTGGCPPTFDATAYENRNVVEHSFAYVKQWRVWQRDTTSSRLPIELLS